MKNTIIAIIACLLLGSISLSAKAPEKAMDDKFNNYKERFILQLWKTYPSWATSAGYHEYDAVLIVPNDQSRTNELAFCKNHLDTLKRFKIEDLSDDNKTDYYLIQNQLKSTIWNITELKAWQWDASQYNVCGTFSEMLNSDFADVDTKLQICFSKMLKISDYYEAARKNLKNPTKEHIQLAIEQNLGGMTVFQIDYIDCLNKSHIPDSNRLAFHERNRLTMNIIKDHIEWLKNLQNDNPRSFRLGKDLYQKKFDFELQSGYKADEIYAKAISHKQELHEKMFGLTIQLWKKYFNNESMPVDTLVAIKQLISVLSKNHVSQDSFKIAIENQLPELTEFIKSKDLIYMDPSKPLVVRKEPGYMAGVAGASISAPGPYEKKGNTYYNVGSLEGWEKEKAESYLKEYNNYTMQILNIHEAIPGHYTQLVHANKNPSMIKSILGNNAMIEGWAVYGERMMIENGYGGYNGIESKVSSPEMWLMYYKWNLRSTCNTILDYSVHTKNMSKEEALKLLQDEAFQEKTEAEGKWKRVSVTQVQLDCYFTGYTEIYDFRQEEMNRLKDKFDLKKFHERFLSYGSAPVKYIKELMTK